MRPATHHRSAAPSRTVRRAHRSGAPRAAGAGPSSARSGELGAGLVGALAGVLVFLTLLLFAVQVLVHLYATSTVTAAGYDAARTVASHAVDHRDAGAVAAARRRAETRFRDLVGAAAEGATLVWAADQESVRLEVTVDGPSILPTAVSGGFDLGRIERTFVVRREEPR